jgi:hypothetical protein
VIGYKKSPHPIGRSQVKPGLRWRLEQEKPESALLELNGTIADSNARVNRFTAGFFPKGRQ